MQLNESLKTAISEHAWADFPNECCGLIVHNSLDDKLDYIRMMNIADDPADRFEMDAAEYAKLECHLDIKAIVHSHPNATSEPSEIDRVQMGLHGLPWVIVGLGIHSDGKRYCTITTTPPKAYQVPLIGREYYHGVQDCYSLVRDFYCRELYIDLPNFERLDAWWEIESHEPLYENNFKAAGFVQIGFDGLQTDSLQYGDVLLCRVGRTYHINHALIWLGSQDKLKSEQSQACIGNTLILHHPYGRQSVREIFGKGWADRVGLVVRHKALSQANL